MENDRLIPFGKLLHTFRTQKNIRQQNLAEKLSVHRNTIGAWERGDRLPDTKGMVLELARHLHLDDDETRLLLEASLTGLSPYWLVPYQRNPFFTGRAEILQTLHAQLNMQQSVALTQSYALSGLGGIGKTQLAVEYAYQYALDYRAVLWIAAETIDTINASFTAIAEQMQLPERKEEDHQKIVKAILHWLATHKEWLIIFDNVEDVQLIKPFLPSSRQGTVLLTTRLHTVDALAYSLELAPLSREEGINFLLRRAKLSSPSTPPEHLPDELRTAAKVLVETMDGLPLALDQVGAYIEHTRCSFTDYLHMYQSHQFQLLNARSETADHPQSVVKTVLFSFEKLLQANEAAADLLRICAFLAPDAIPEEFFTRGTASLGPLLDAVTSDLYHFNRVLGDALHYSLLHRESQHRTLSLHRVVQIVLKATMDETTAQHWAVYAAAAVATCVSSLQEQNAEVHDDSYLPHARTILQHFQQWNGWEEQASLIPIWYYIGSVEEQYSQLANAREAYLKGATSAHLHHHPLEAPLLVHLALMISDLGDDLQALTYLEQGAILARQLHDEKTLCLILLNQGQIQDNFGNYHLAKTLYQEGLSIALRIQDWATASAFSQDLGVQAIRRGDYTLTSSLYQQGLTYARQSALLGRQSALLMNLGMLAIHQQQYDQALTYTLESLHLAQQVRHRYRISATSQNLGIIYRLRGQPEQARHYLDDSLRLAQEIQHPWLIAETQGEYGWLLLGQEQSQEAQEMFQLMLTGAQDIQAQELIARALFGLAQVAAQQRRWEQAKSLAQESLELFTDLDDAQHQHVSQWLKTLSSSLTQ